MKNYAFYLDKGNAGWFPIQIQGNLSFQINNYKFNFR